MSDDAPKSEVEGGSAGANAADARSRPSPPAELADLDSLQRSAAIVLGTVRGIDAVGDPFSVTTLVRDAVAQFDQAGLLAIKRATLAGSGIDALVKNATAAQQIIGQDIRALTEIDQSVLYGTTLARTAADLGMFFQRGLAAHAALGINTASMIQRIMGDHAVLYRTLDSLSTLAYPPGGFLYPLPNRPARAYEPEGEEDYEIELTASGLYAAKRGRGRPVGSTYVKHEEYVQVLHLFVDRHHRAPSIGQLAATIGEMLTIPISKDTVKRYAITWFGSWLAVQKYCWRLMAGKD